MASHASVNVGTAAGVLVAAGGPPGVHQFSQSRAPRTVTLKPAAAISVGGPGVTVADGLDIAAGAVVSIQTNDALYAIGAAATTCKVLIA